ncbi:MAG: GTPase Era [Lachnospiraceae bacterium]|nr:GTPase Era [Lachnospiraceae bacterium]
MDDKDVKRSGFVALVGRPNVGKSTLMNRLIGQKIAITSAKPQTTRNRIQTVYTDERGQVVFLDTPGMHKAKNKLGDYMVSVAYHTLQEADIVLFLVEPDQQIGNGDLRIMETLAKTSTPVFLVINKTDTIKREEVLAVIDAFRGKMEFAEVIPVSAMTGDNTDDLLDTVFSYLKEGPQFYDEDTVTDQPIRQIAAELIREQALRLLSEEIPHGIAVVIDQMEWKQRIVNVDATIICERDSHKGIIIGKGGAMLKKIGSGARYGMEELCSKQVNLKIWVKVKKDWRESDYLIKNFGYDPGQIPK